MNLVDNVLGELKNCCRLSCCCWFKKLWFVCFDFGFWNWNFCWFEMDGNWGVSFVWNWLFCDWGLNLEVMICDGMVFNVYCEGVWKFVCEKRLFGLLNCIWENLIWKILYLNYKNIIDYFIC